jgi:hypothetical protein
VKNLLPIDLDLDTTKRLVVAQKKHQQAKAIVRNKNFSIQLKIK